MNNFIFWLVFGLLLFIIIYCDKKFNLLRDTSINTVKSFSYSRVQFAWWMLIVLSSFISILLRKHAIPTFNNSTLFLLGISSATTATATLIDISDQHNPALVKSELSQNDKGVNLFLDILSDKNGVSMHRLQTVILNIVFGVWFIIAMLHSLNAQNVMGDWINCPEDAKDGFCIYVNSILPVISQNNLVLLGLSTGTYAALKMTENKQVTLTSAALKNNQQTEEEAVG